MTTTLTPRVTAVTQALQGLQARRAAVGDQLTVARRTMQGYEDTKAHLVQCSAVLDRLTQEVAKSGVSRVEQVVTQGLQTVFGPQVSCVLERKDGARGTTYAIKLKVNTPEGDVIGDPMDSFGGGAVNVVSFLLRVLMIHRFKLSRLMVLDESMNNVSREYLPAVSSLFRTLVEDHGYNILAITHQPELAQTADHAYKVSGPIGAPTIQLLGAGDE